MLIGCPDASLVGGNVGEFGPIEVYQATRQSVNQPTHCEHSADIRNDSDTGSVVSCCGVMGKEGQIDAGSAYHRHRASVQ